MPASMPRRRVYHFAETAPGPKCKARGDAIGRLSDKAGVRATPHTFRHQAITWLTRNSGLADAELQLITGHARRETSAIYHHIALDGELEGRYQEAMRKVEI